LVIAACHQAVVQQNYAVASIKTLDLWKIGHRTTNTSRSSDAVFLYLSWCPRTKGAKLGLGYSLPAFDPLTSGADGCWLRGRQRPARARHAETGTHDSVGVQGQVFTIINDESYYYPDLFRGAIVDGDFWKYVTKYTGSTTGTSRSNVICSSYTPITWQVDRKCHLISASSFDKMCADMKAQRDDMTGDLYPHGARELVTDALAANNHQPRL
jgi:hypothetical protein